MNETTLKIVLEEKVIFRSEKRGIAPLVAVVESGVNVKNCVAYDKIVGKAAAMLYILLQVAEVHADVMSRAAKELLQRNNIVATYNVFAENIINRSGTGLCPMEQAVADVDTPKEALCAIKTKLKELQK